MNKSTDVGDLKTKWRLIARMLGYPQKGGRRREKASCEMHQQDKPSIDIYLDKLADFISWAIGKQVRLDDGARLPVVAVLLGPFGVGHFQQSEVHPAPQQP